MNPLLTGRIPGVTFQLPSQGLFYTNGELEADVNMGEVHIFPMTAYEDILIRTPDLLYSGEGFNQVISKCVPQVKKPSMLLSKDVDFIMTALRSVSMGDEVDISASHSCENAIEHNYIINISDFPSRSATINQTILSHEYSCDIAGMDVRLVPIRFGSMIKLLSQANALDDSKDSQSLVNEYYSDMLNQVSDLILSVSNPDNDTVVVKKEWIVEWLASIPIADLRKLNDKISSASEWGADLSYTVKCKDCGELMTVSVPLNPMRFFS